VFQSTSSDGKENKSIYAIVPLIQCQNIYFIHDDLQTSNIATTLHICGKHLLCDRCHQQYRTCDECEICQLNITNSRFEYKSCIDTYDINLFNPTTRILQLKELQTLNYESDSEEVTVDRDEDEVIVNLSSDKEDEEAIMNLNNININDTNDTTDIISFMD
jgi:hypothetical protein